MAISLSRDVSRKWLLARATGSLSASETVGFLKTARADIDVRMWPLLFDARSCSTLMTDDDIERAVDIVREAVHRRQRRGHVALVADHESLYRWFLVYETKCVEAGVRVIRVFRRYDDAVRWLEIVSAAREFT